MNEPHIRAKQLLRELFHYYLKHPEGNRRASPQRIRKAGLHRAVCDYLAGMTDRYVQIEYQRLFGRTPQD